MITINLYSDLTQFHFENIRPASFEGQKSILYKINFSVYNTITLNDLLIKGISNFNEYFLNSKIPLRLKEYNSNLLGCKYALKQSKKNGLPKMDNPSEFCDF